MIIISILCIAILIIIFTRSEGFAVQSTIDGNTYDVLDEEDKQVAADQLAKINLLNERLIEYMNLKYHDGIHARIARNLKRRYRRNLIENNPKTTENTSYTENKGAKIAFCLRDRPSRDLHKFDDFIFVNLHELAHIGCEEYGHEQEFWETFVFIQHVAKEAGLYRPKDYSKTSVNYCGVNVQYNPYFDAKYRTLILNKN